MHALYRMCISVVLVLACLGGARFAQAFDAPAFQGDVLDETGTLTPEEQETLRNRIRELRDNSGIWAAVYVAKSLQGDSIEGAADAIFQKWKLGQAGKDNGLLVLVVPSERKMRIEVGYGLEGFITDAFSKRVIDEIYKPAFRQNQFAEGLLQGFDAMAKMARGEAMPEPQVNLSAPPAEADVDWSNAGRNFGLTLLFNLLPIGWYTMALLYGRMRGRMAEGSVWKNVKVGFLFSLFFGVFFGIFVMVFSAAFNDEWIPVAMILGMNILFASFTSLPLILQSRRYLTAAGYRREQARLRLLRIRQRSKTPREIFGKFFDPAEVSVSDGGTRRETSSSGSSWSSGSSSSSSSGGGRSGGGGASGSW